MDSCRDINPLVTRLADDEATAAERRRVDGHAGACPACHLQLHAEREVRQLVMDRSGELVGHAPLGLRAKCLATRTARASARRGVPCRSSAGPAGPWPWRRRW